MRIPVINPVKTATGRKVRRHHMAKGKARRKGGKRKLSAAQKANLAKGRAIMAALRAKKAAPAPKRRKVKRHRKGLKAGAGLSLGRHRPVVIVSRKGLRRPKKSHIRARARFVNPFMGELAMLGNPRHSRRRKSRRNPIALRGIGSGIMAAPKEMVKGSFVMDAAGVAAGFVLPNLVVSRLPAAFRDATWKVYASKVGSVAVLSVAAGLVNKKLSRLVLLGGGVSILLDLWQDFVAPRVGMTAAAPAQSHYYGGMGHYYGDGQLGEDAGYIGEGGNIADAFAGE